MPHRALVWLLSRVSAHVHHQHVLGFEGPQLPGAASPVTHELLPLPMDVLAVDVLRRETKSGYPTQPFFHHPYLALPLGGKGRQCAPHLKLL